MINPTSIQNILTLRYDPTQYPLLPKLTNVDYTSNEKPSSEKVESLLLKAVNDQTDNKSPEKISIALSGGVDSTLILKLIHQLFPKTEINAISIRFSESVDETKSAAVIADKFNANHHIVHLENYLNELPKAISIVGMPFWDLHWYHVAKKAQTISRYLASGDGGDEIFGGYTFRYKKFLSLTTENSTPQDKVMVYLKCHERDWVPDQEKIFTNKIHFNWEDIYRLLIPYFDNKLSRLDQVLLADYNGKLLYNFSIINTSINRFFNIKSVTPLLSQEIIQYVTKISNQFKYDTKNDVGKLLLRELTKKYNLDSVLTTEKLGFNVNTINLWKNYGQRLCKYYLLDSRIIKDGWINFEWINHHINEKDLNVWYVNKFLGLLSFEIWYRLFVTKEIDSNTKLE